MLRMPLTGDSSLPLAIGSLWHSHDSEARKVDLKGWAFIKPHNQEWERELSAANGTLVS